MNGFLARIIRTERIVLVLRGQQANWSLWRGGRCVESRDACDGIAAAGIDGGDIAGDGTAESSQLVCPWSASGDIVIDVVADSPLDEIDQVMAATVIGNASRSSAARNRLTRYLLRSRLRWRHRSEGVRMAPVDASPILGALLRAELPTAWRRQLDELQTGSVIVRRLHSAIRLRESPSTGGDVLQVIGGGGVERHTYYCGGCPLFTRVVTPRDTAGSRDAVAETLAHVLAQFDREAPRVEHVADDNGWELARRALTTRGEQLASPILEKQSARAEHRRLHLMSGMTAFIACIAVLIASIHGVDSARDRARAIAEQEALQDRVESVRRRFDASHVTPERAAESLALIDAHASGQPPQSADVLRLLASVLSEHPGIRLDSLSWNTRPSRASSGDAGVNDILWLARPADLPSSPSMASMVSDAAVDGDELPSLRLEFALEVTGRVVAEARDDATNGAVKTAASIGDRQRRFDAFVEALRIVTHAAAIHVQTSPVTAASRGGLPAAASSADFELRIRYTAA